MPRVSSKDLRSRRSEILEGARGCFAEFGYDGATVSRLEAATGKSRGAIFHHFGSKEGLFLALAEEDADRMAEVTASSGLVEVMRDVVAHPDQHEWLGTRLEIVGRLRTDVDFRRKWLEHQEHRDGAVRNRLRDSAKSGSLRDDYSPEAMRLMLEIMLDGIITRVATGRSTEGMDEVLDLIEESVRRPR